MITSHRSIFAVWCCSLRSTCDLVIGLTVNECVSVCVCLFVLQAWLCLIALGVSCLDPTTGRGNDTTILIEQQPEFDSWIQRVSECDVHFKKKVQLWAALHDWPAFFLFQSQTIPYSLTLWRVYRCKDSFYKLISQNEMEDKKTVGVSASYCIILVFPSSL